MASEQVHPAPGRSARFAGILCGAGAGALWGLVFLAPQLVSNFSPLEMTIGRFLAYGIISALLIAPRWSTIRSKLGRSEWIALAWLSIAGNTMYYILLSGAVLMGGIALTSLVIGFLPVAVTIIGSKERGAVPLKRLAASLALCAGGAVCIGWQAIASPVEGSLVGLLLAVGALVSWTIYGVGNSRWLARVRDVSSHDWGLLTGLVTGAQSLLLVPIALILAKTTYTAVDWLNFAGVSIGLALLASIAGNALWNQASRLLPLTLLGQMVLFETLFALIYGFVWDQRLPSVLEAAAFILAVLSVGSCISAHREPLARNGSKLRPAGEH